LSQLKKKKLEAAGLSGAVQALRMENDAPVVGPDALTANCKMVKLDIATADWSRPTSGLPVIQPRSIPVPSRIAAISAIALLTQEIGHQVPCGRDNSKLLKGAKRFHQHPVLDDLILHDAVDGKHPYLHLLAARGNS
jgi:hypothetical protein